MSGQPPPPCSQNWTRSSTLPSIPAPATPTINARTITHASRTGWHRTGGGQIVFCNPPYGRAIADWVRKCSAEAKKPHTRVVMLIPARTDTAYFHDYIYHKASEVRFLRGRLHFNEAGAAPFPSMVVVF